MDSSSESESDKPLKPRSQENDGRMSGRRSQWNVELDIASASSSSKSQPCNYDGYRGYNHSSMRLEMDLFAKSQCSAATSSYSSSDKYSEKGALFLNQNSDIGTIMSSSSTEQASMVSDIPHESPMGPMSPVQSPPPLQVMGCSGGYDPGRIPSLVFERSKGPTLVEWSIASTESLFSIHIGNVSFSKDRFPPHVGDLPKSEDLGKIKKSDFNPSLKDEGASDSPITQLGRSFRDNENTAGVVNAIEFDEGNEYNIIKEKRDDSIVTRMPSLKNDQDNRSPSLPASKKNSFSPKPKFRWLRKICCWTSNCTCPSCSCSGCCPSCSLWPCCHCKCPSHDCKCTCPDCSCSWLACCFRWQGCCPGCCCCCCNSSSCGDLNCFSKGCCSCPSSGCWTLSFSCKSCCYYCLSCKKCRLCC